MEAVLGRNMVALINSLISKDLRGGREELPYVRGRSKYELRLARPFQSHHLTLPCQDQH